MNLTQLNHTFSHIPKTLSGIVNCDMKFLELSEKARIVHGYKNQEQLIGTSLFDIPCAISNSAPDLVYQWAHVFKNKDSLFIIDIQKTAVTEMSLLITEKQPCYDRDGTVRYGQFHSIEIEDTDKKAHVLRSILPNIRCFLNHKAINISLTLIEKYQQFNLSVRESDVLYYICLGYSGSDIATLLSISNRTVETHTSHLKEKLKCKKRSELIEYSYAQNVFKMLPISVLNNALF